jgi:hypothetical protein
MRAISFTLRPDLSEQDKERTLETMQAIEGVVSTSLFLPDAGDDPILARVGYAYIREPPDATAIEAQISAIHGVEAATIAGDRYLR